jgi:hypothetical protein
MRFKASSDDWDKVTAEATGAMASAMTGGMDDITRGFTLALRDQIVASGLGQRLANTWRGRRYPEGRNSLTPAAFVWSKAPDIVDSFARGATIVPINGRRYLALPTENVPARKRGDGGRGKKMSPEQVEIAFNGDLHFAKAGGTGRLIAYINVVGAKNRRGFRAATAKRLAQGRQAASVVMFILVPVVRMPKRLEPEAVYRDWVARVPDAITAHWRF